MNCAVDAPVVTIVGYACLDSAVEIGQFNGVEATSILRGPIVADTPGIGGVAHLARAAVRAGASVRVVTWLGDDAPGARWRERVAAEGVDVAGVATLGSRSPAATLLYLSSGGTICLFDPGDCHGESLDERQLAAVIGSDAVILTVADRSHTEALLDNLPATTLLAWAVKNDADAYPPTLVQRVLDRADIVSYSRGERPFLTASGGETALGVAPERRVRPGTLLVETRGAQGAQWWVAGEDPASDLTGSVSVDPMVGVDTTGAGDTLIASLVTRHVYAVGNSAIEPTPVALSHEIAHDLVLSATRDVASMLRSRAERTTPPIR